jgi:cytochrome P450
MIKASNEAPSDSDSKSQTPQAPILSKSEIIGNSFIFLFAGHETSANSIHFSIILLAIHLASQVRLQADIDRIVGRDKPLSELSYYEDMPRLYNSMVGAVMNEQLRLMPAILNVPKLSSGDHVVKMDGQEFVVPKETYLRLDIVATNRNPRYWPYSPSKITGKDNDLHDFVPERWLPSKSSEAPIERPETRQDQNLEAADGMEETAYDRNTSESGSLFKPVKSSFISFSEGARACPGKRFAQVEITAVLTAIFQKYTAELDVANWASDEEVSRMGSTERKAVYQKAMDRASKLLARSEQRTITLQMRQGDKIPVRFVERGKERFAGLFL